jgi:thiol-disulfide isomerase/thioredoxin
MMRKILSLVAFSALLLSSAAFSKDLNTGPWRFELKTAYAVVPFVMDLHMKKDRLIGTLHNGKETIILDQINYNRKKKKLSIPIQNYEITLELEYEDSDFLKGYLVRHNKNPKSETPVVARHGESVLFPGDRASSMADFNGKWSVFLEEDEVKTPGVLVIEQQGNKINGSLLTQTGDYRYFSGYASVNRFEAASFDGMYNYIIQGSLEKDELTANLLTNYRMNITGKKDPKAALPDAFAQTKIEKLEFAFQNTEKQYISLKHKRFQGKPVIVQFFGSWCPNCMDEMNFLIPWYKANQKRGIEIVALAFERSVDHEHAMIQLKKTQKLKNVPYPLLLAGSTAEDKPMEKIKGLKNFISFPTTVFLNRKHEVVKVHAGFSGPSTGEYFEQWKKEFKTITDNLLKR